MKKQYFVVLLAFLIVSSFPMFGQQQVSIRGSLAIGIETDIVNNYWAFGYGAIFVPPGTPWQLTLSGGDPNTQFALCSTKDD